MRRLLILFMLAAAGPSICEIGPAKSGSDDGNHPRPNEPAKANVSVPTEWRFEPPWQGKGDCGPLSLYVLLRLEDQPVTYDQVKAALPHDPERGCSLADV